MWKMLALFKERMGCSAELQSIKEEQERQFAILFVKRQKIDALTKDEDELIIKKSVEEMFLSDDEYQPKISV